jgi:chromatin segregation and condensation protein Rec8/ScpA/Scc1 (kleisin family)
VGERRAFLLRLLRDRHHVRFSEVAGTTVDEVIATFLAILELFRRGLAQVDQRANFGDLVLSPPEQGAAPA